MRPTLRLAAAVASAGLLMGASSALGATAPTNVSSNPFSPDNDASWTFSWDAGSPEVAGPVTYQGGVVATAGEEPTTAISPGDLISVPFEGNVFFKVRSIEPGAADSAYTTLAIQVDRSGPTVSSITLSGPAGGVDGWYRGFSAPPLNVQLVGCTDNGGAGGGCGNQTWTTEGFFAAGAAAITLTDVLGNQSFPTIPEAFGYDAQRPRSGTFGAPTGTGTLVAAEPNFEWTPSEDAGTLGIRSGIYRYEVAYAATADVGGEFPAGGQLIAERLDDGRVGFNYVAQRDVGGPLPQNEDLQWWVRTFDRAGNVRNSAVRNLRIDPTIPPAPTITGGPNAPTQDNAPTFTWEGTQTNFHWDVTLVGAQTPARQGGGSATQTTVTALPDGDYTFRVIQITQAGQGSAEATRSFKVDTTAPAAPTITARPTFPAISATPLFAWSAEPGAYSRWSIFDGAGASVYGPIDTPVTNAELPPLAEGSYSFQVVQIDPAGNVSPPTVETFTVLAPLAAPTPGQNARSAFLAALPKQNALRLKPKAGTTLPTLRPLLRWKKGPRGTKLYNLQIFKVTARKGGKPKVTKVLSRFPRGLTFRTPRKNLAAGTCYVWRVWPYTGRAFTTRPVGVSNFCIAGKKVLRAKALKAAGTRKK
jgi:hypothetical protein